MTAPQKRSVPKPVFTDAEAGAKTFPDSTKREFNYYTPQKRKQSRYEDVTVEVQPDPRHYLSQGWLYGFSDGRGGYPLDWTALKAWGSDRPEPERFPGSGGKGYDWPAHGWHLFRDPNEEWELSLYRYNSNVIRQLNQNVDVARQSRAFDQWNRNWVRFVESHVGAWMHVDHGLGLYLFANANRRAPTNMHNNAISVNSMHRIRSAQDLALYNLTLSEEIDGFDGTAHLAAWNSDPAWQGVREVAEQLTGIDDWAEAIFAANVIFEPLVGELFRSQLVMQAAPRNGDFVTPTVVGAEEYDFAERDLRYTTAMFHLLTNDREFADHNKGLLGSWLSTWTARALTASRTLQPLWSQPDNKPPRFEDGLDAAKSRFAGILNDLNLDTPKQLANGESGGAAAPGGGVTQAGRTERERVDGLRESEPERTKRRKKPVVKKKARKRAPKPPASARSPDHPTRHLSPGLLRPDDGAAGGGDGGGGGNGTSTSGNGAEQPDQRFFLAELEDHPTLQPLKKAEQYTIAFSVGPSSAGAVGAERFPDEVLAAAATDVDVFDLTVQLNSEDFKIFGDSTRPLRVPRAGRSLGKARFEIAPRRNGWCQLVASVHYKGNFVHQMELMIPVGGRRRVPVEVSTRGRPPDSAVALEPRDISILLEPAPAGGFQCTALGSVVKRTVLPITNTELNAAVDSARSAMMSVIQSVYAGSYVFQSGIDVPAEARDSALRTLARAGSRLFQHLFLHSAAGADARAIGEWLRGYAMNPGLRLTVQIVADQAPLPWAMLYLGDASEGAALNWNNFLGMRHIVEQLPLQTSLGTRENEILSKPNLAVSVNVNTSIDTSMGITLVAEHQKYWRDSAIAWAGLKLVSRSTKSEVVRALADASTGDQVVYFYCHATAGGQNKRDPDAAAIIMGKNDAATVADLNIDAPTTVQLAGNPLVFINACESAELSPLFYNGFVPYFMAKGARGVIGTECKTPVLFAIKWANAFFEQFLDGETVGETVLKLRQDFLRKHGNPLGLIYAIHCDADTRIAPALVQAKTQRKRKTP